MPAKRKSDPSISDDAVKAATGKSWAHWFTLLDKWGAKKKPHKEIAAHLHDDLGMRGWWSQMVAVEYERARGLRVIGERPAAAGFSVDVQRTVRASARRAYDTFLKPEHVSKWFSTKARAELKIGGSYQNADGDKGQYLALDPPRRARFSWDNEKHCPGTMVELTVRPAGDGKVAVRISHTRLKTQKHRNEMKEGWSWAMDSYKSYIETGQPIPHKEWLSRKR